MGLTTNNDLSKLLNDKLTEAMKQHIGKVFDEAIEQAVKDATAKRDEFIAQQALKMTTWMQIQDMSRQLVITIEKPKHE